MHHNSYYNVLKTDICEYAVNWSHQRTKTDFGEAYL